MKFHAHSGRHARRCGGQTFLFIAIFAAMFLAGVIGLATDYSQLWARRQMAQAAADAACQAGAADLYIQYAAASGASSTYGLNFSWIGTDYDCSTNTTSAPCLYASYNGYSGSNVAVSFPSSVPGAPSLSGFGVTHPYIKVAVTDTFPLSFSRIFVSSSTASISAYASCGLVIVNAPIPLLVMHPSDSGSLDRNGNASITIIGGPTKSIQVNSASSTAVTPTSGGSGTIDLRAAGTSGTGADFGVFGPESQPSYVLTGTGSWKSPSLPYTDPWASVAAPSAPATAGQATYAGFGTNGCPDPAGCVEFSAGNYSSCVSNNSNLGAGGNGCLILPTPYKFNIPNWNNNHPYNVGEIVQPNSHNTCNCVYQVTTAGTSQNGSGPNPWNQTTGGTQADGTVTWTNLGPSFANSPKTAIFDPGVYYVGAAGLQLGSNSTVRMSTATGDGSGGTTFYFAGTPGGSSTPATVSVASNTGSQSGCVSPSTSNCIVSYKPGGTSQTFGSVTIASPQMKCSSGAALPAQVPATVDGNVLMGPCSGTYQGGSSANTDRGFLFFQQRSTSSVAASWGGGGSFVLSGFMYFHNSSDNSMVLTMGGNSGGTALALGDIVTDKMAISGTPNFSMILNPNVTSAVLKPQLLQ